MEEGVKKGLVRNSLGSRHSMINLDDVEDGIGELERPARLGLADAMITEYPAEDRRYDQPERSEPTFPPIAQGPGGRAGRRAGQDRRFNAARVYKFNLEG
jgi:hypothetical protein